MAAGAPYQTHPSYQTHLTCPPHLTLLSRAGAAAASPASADWGWLWLALSRLHGRLILSALGQDGPPVRDELRSVAVDIEPRQGVRKNVAMRQRALGP